MLKIALPALLLAVAAASCSSDAETSSSQHSGEQLYNTYCAACHGKDGRGTAMGLGPGFEGIQQHWDAPKLLEYIADPKAFAANVDRLGKREMAAIADDVSPEDRAKLVEHALSLMN